MKIDMHARIKSQIPPHPILHKKLNKMHKNHGKKIAITSVKSVPQSQSKNVD